MMSLQPQAEYCVPLETARVAKTVFPNGSIYLTLAGSGFRGAVYKKGQECAPAE
jgi:hypothetical protein